MVELLDDEWQWVAPDLPGQRRSAPLARYPVGGLAAVVAETVRRAFDDRHEAIARSPKIADLADLVSVDAPQQ